VGGDTFPGLRTLDRARHNLPVQTTELFGRSAHIATVADLVRGHRLVTLTGVGGAGKTRLALAVAADLVDELDDGVFFAPLAAIDDPAEISAAVGNAVGMTVGSDDLESVAAFVSSRSLLVVVDNCEHLIDGVAELVEAVLVAGPQGRVLATSREALQLDGESLFTVPSLETRTVTSAAVRLLVDRGRRVRPDLALDDASQEAMVEICARLDGIPLALELAAAQLAHLSPVELAERLDDRFRLLVGGRRRRLPRQQTLQAMMDWSWDLLEPDERDVLSQLSVFAGGWTLEAAEGVCRPRSGAAVAVVLHSLVSKSLVEREARADRSRYRMLETVRIYGLQQLLAAGATQDTRNRHAHYFCSAAEAVPFSDRFMLPRLGTRWAAEVDNIIAVADWLEEEDRLHEAATLLTMPGLIWRFLPIPPPLRRAVGQLLAGPLDDRVRCLLLIASREAGTVQSGLSRRGDSGRQAVELASSLGDDALASVALTMHGSPFGATDPDRAEDLLTDAARSASAAGDARLEAMALGMLAGVEAFGRQHFDRARELLEQADAIATADGFENQAILSQLLTLEVMTGRWSAANVAYRRLLDYHRSSGHPVSWHDAIDDAVFACELGEDRCQPLAKALDELRASGGQPDWPDLLMIPMGQACRQEDWPRVSRIVACVRASARAGRTFGTSHATAYYYHYRRRLPSGALTGADPWPVADLLATELAAEESAA
ncbi:MAG: hypothetical protein OEV40_05420, partial [Acidimicrobiia bacterium]|nr:hypothetical protein [Acidimicrobiia bacterium]